jgi:hypothetical protein
MKLSAEHRNLRQKAIAQLTELVLANQKPVSFLDGKDAINFEVQGARFLTVRDGKLKAINIMRYYVDIDTIPLLKLINFIESFEPATNETN